METKAKKETPADKVQVKATAEKKKNEVKDTAAEKKTATTRTAKKDKQGTEFREFFIDELKDILWAEKALLKAMPKLRKAATGKELAASFDEQTKGTQAQIEVIEQVFDAMGEKPATKKCDAMEGLLAEAESIIEDTDKGTAIRDAGLILATQKCKHYEIATYGTLAALADAMAEKKVAKLLRTILTEQKDSDKELTVLAVESVNEDAAKE